MTSEFRILLAGLTLLGLATSPPVPAQTGASGGAPNAASSLDRPPVVTPGRLFFSAERRQALDQQRKSMQFRETVVEGDKLSLDGVVTRSSGKWTMWINGNAVTEKDSTSVGARPLAGSPAQGRLSAGGESAGASTLVVGNGIDRSTGASTSLLGNGSIRVHSRAARR